jgi:hypothetical protein
VRPERDPEVLRQVQETGYGISGSIGGQPKMRYYTPDGRVIFAHPSMREWRGKDGNGNVISGIRDANLDKGWMMTPPEHPKMYCAGCDKWHDTKEDIDKCIKRKKAFQDKWDKMAAKQIKQESPEPNDINERLGRLEQMMAKLLEVKSGTIFQPEVNEIEADSEQTRSNEEGI